MPVISRDFCISTDVQLFERHLGLKMCFLEAAHATSKSVALSPALVLFLNAGADLPWTVRTTAPGLHATVPSAASAGPRTSLTWAVSSELMGKRPSSCFMAAGKQAFWTRRNTISFPLHVSPQSGVDSGSGLCSSTQTSTSRLNNMTCAEPNPRHHPQLWTGANVNPENLFFKLVNSLVITVLLFRFQKKSSVHFCPLTQQNVISLPPKNQFAFAMSLVTALVIKKPLNISSEKYSRIHLFCLQRGGKKKRLENKPPTLPPSSNWFITPGLHRFLRAPKYLTHFWPTLPHHRAVTCPAPVDPSPEGTLCASPPRRMKHCRFLNPDICYFMPLMQELETSPLVLHDHLSFYKHVNFTWSNILLRLLLLWLTTMDLEEWLIKY